MSNSVFVKSYKDIFLENVEENFLQNNDKHYDYVELTQHPLITIDFIDKYHNKPWDWASVYFKEDITNEFIEKYKSFFPLELLSGELSSLVCQFENSDYIK